MPPRRRAGPVDPLSATEMLQMLQEGVRKQATQPNIYGYEPHAKQALFHKSEAFGRLYIGGNRSGKTTGAVTEDIFWLRGNHPFRRIPEPPIRGRVVGVDFLNGISKIILPQFAQWCPPSLLKDGSWERSYDKEKRILTFENKSFVEFMSYDQDLEKFAGTSRHFVHYDEEPPQHIYNECSMRLIDTDGSWWISMTPVEGMSWIYDTIYMPGINKEDPDIEVIEVDMTENPYLSVAAQKRFLKGLDADERKAREHGTFVQMGGRVYRNFDKHVHVIPPIVPPAKWEWYASLDHGYNNPTAWLWHAVSPEGNVVTFAEHYQSEMTVKEHAAVVHARNAGFGRVPDIFVGDPAISQRQGVTGTSIQAEYADHGIYIVPGNNDVAIGVNRVSQYLRINPRTNKPYWLITENCTNLIREMERLRWKTWSSRKSQFDNNKHDQIHKKDDHAPDSARYFFTVMPDLTPPDEGDKVPYQEFVLGNNVGRDPKAVHLDEALVKMTQGGDKTTKWKTVGSGTDVGAMEWDY